MKRSGFTMFMAGWIGALVFSFIMDYVFDRSSDSFVNAAKPAFEAAGFTNDYTSTNLAKALNPCVRLGPLPIGCEKYVLDGQILQPPIKIIIDEEKEAEQTISK